MTLDTGRSEQLAPIAGLYDREKSLRALPRRKQHRPALSVLNGITRKPDVSALELLPQAFDCAFGDEHFERGRPSSIIIAGWPFNEKQMLVGVAYLAIGVCVTVAA
ncbi:hypothetical protein JJE66_30860 [Bradyrhizobium diazoefficiens]|uniref:hypothetical protein n=1 Tax=Bradyrhizobium diazoefficiens TaxID=1355477 RepID=UPI00190C83AC|nr:hypothetical protein [Bradyrhizobium diazoefficiens]MBK3665611.1 hypothetical protein [Bradyrhizobium diazoefficiens]